MSLLGVSKSSTESVMHSCQMYGTTMVLRIFLYFVAGKNRGKMVRLKSPSTSGTSSSSCFFLALAGAGHGVEKPSGFRRPGQMPPPLTPATGTVGVPMQAEVPLPPPPMEPELPISSFVGFLPLLPGEQGPAASHHPGVPTPRKGTPVMTRDSVSGGRRALSPTAYKPSQISALISAWSPAGIATIHDGKEESRRIYQ